MVPDEPRIVLQAHDGESWPVDSTPLTIGRGARNTISLPDPRVSRSHATIWATEGRCWIRDEHSTHGTRVSGQQVVGVREIRPGDSIELPGHVFGVRAAAPERPREAPGCEAPVPEPVGGEPARSGRAPRSRSLPLLLGVGAAVAVVVGLVLWLVLRSDHDRPAGAFRPSDRNRSSQDRDDSTSGETTDLSPIAPRNTVVLFIATSDHSSEYLAEYDITVESGRQNILRLAPFTGQLAQVDWNVTASYAKSTIRPYTVDGRFFVVRHTGLETNDHHTFTEYDPRTNEKLLTFYVSDPINHSCVAILGDDYYYESYRTYDSLYGDRDGEFKHLRIEDGATGEGDELMEHDDPEGCHGHLAASDGVLYDALQNDGQILFYRRDLTTGRHAEALGGVTLHNPERYDERMEIAFDEGMAYLLTRRLMDNQIAIYAYAFRDEPVLVYKGSQPDVDQPHYMDVDEGYLVVGDPDGYVLLVDLLGGTSRIIEVGFGFYDVQVLYTGDR